MTIRDAPPDDLIGIGFGPSNLALAIALDEHGRGASARRDEPLRYRFIERQPRFTWHGGMLLPGSDMQISFLKDLVMQRDPTSPLTFVNYLHSQGRLEDFINLGTFYPSRIEFNDYLRWVAERFADRCCYGETVIAVEPEETGEAGRIEVLLVRTRDADGRERTRRTYNLVVAIGGTPHIPAVFAEAIREPRVFHSSHYLDRLGDRSRLATLRLDEESAHVAVIGGGQSAVEISYDLHERFKHLKIDLIFRGHALKPSDSSPFVNEIFNPEYTDFIYGQSDERRDVIVRNFRNTNYAVIDPDLLHALYAIVYRQKVSGTERLRLLPRRHIEQVARSPDRISLRTTDHFASTNGTTGYNCVILATGYERNAHRDLLEPLNKHIKSSTIRRDYCLEAQPKFAPRIYMQGYSEISHGLSDTLISVLSMRSQEIVDSLTSMPVER
ncbi:MAG: lysine N(6)-hydroxylase/L-ornithine N(5)-oxygenase family protein [Methylorubrum populi]